jgi:hypothetical protein
LVDGFLAAILADEQLPFLGNLRLLREIKVEEGVFDSQMLKLFSTMRTLHNPARHLLLHPGFELRILSKRRKKILETVYCADLVGYGTHSKNDSIPFISVPAL